MNLAKLPESRINLSDIREIKSLPPDAEVGKFYRPKKTSVTIRLDADVLAWIKAAGDGYQTRVNTYLRTLMRRGQMPRSRDRDHAERRCAKHTTRVFFRTKIGHTALGRESPLDHL